MLFKINHMSKKISFDSLSDEDLKVLSHELQVEQEVGTNFKKEIKYICLYDAEQNDLYVPFSYNYVKHNKHIIHRRPRSDFPDQNPIFTGELRDKQKKVKTEAVNYLNEHGSVTIACFPGFGKTCLGIYLACKLKMKTLILCHRIVLINQWKESIKKFCPNATFQILEKGKEMQDVDFYIINASNVHKYSRKFFSEIGVLIVDECHLIMAEKLSQCMRYILPRYLIGLSATPYRNDGLDCLLDMYFGKHKIEIKLHRKHTVYKVNTGFKPEIKLNSMGKIDWSSILDSQCNNQKRNELIIRILRYFRERVFLVLCKRVDQAEYIYERLREEKEDVTSLIGKNQSYEQTSRILVGTVQKTGTGFDHPRLNAMILASDVESYFIQYLGRVFRREDTEPIIFDLVDRYGLLEKHFRTRQNVYTEHGGIVKDFFREFPEF